MVSEKPHEKEGKSCSIRVKEEVHPGVWDHRTYAGVFVSFEKQSDHTRAVVRLEDGTLKRGWIYNLRFNKEVQSGK